MGTCPVESSPIYLDSVNFKCSRFTACCVPVTQLAEEEAVCQALDIRCCGSVELLMNEWPWWKTTSFWRTVFLKPVPSCFMLTSLSPKPFTYPLTVRVVGAPQMTSQLVSSIPFCSPLPSGTWWTPGLSIPWFCLPTSFPVCLVFFHLLPCLARWFWLDLMNGRHDHTTAVSVSLRWSGGLGVVRW